MLEPVLTKEGSRVGRSVMERREGDQWSEDHRFISRARSWTANNSLSVMDQNMSLPSCKKMSTSTSSPSVGQGAGLGESQGGAGPLRSKPTEVLLEQTVASLGINSVILCSQDTGASVNRAQKEEVTINRIEQPTNGKQLLIILKRLPRIIMRQTLDSPHRRRSKHRFHYRRERHFIQGVFQVGGCFAEDGDGCGEAGAAHGFAGFALGAAEFGGAGGVGAEPEFFGDLGRD